jgi:hypothetical protein
MASMILIGAIANAAEPVPRGCEASEPFCLAPRIGTTPGTIAKLNMPGIATPAWQVAAAQAAAGPRAVTYTIATRGTVTAVDEFAAQVAETFADTRGWSRLGVRFDRVESGGQFTVWLSEASQVPSFSQGGCDTLVSCTVGSNVIINQDRWLGGSDAWNGAGGSLRDYRHMVLNHETGHWLGHNHLFCSGDGQPAPVMQQQTLGMQGCRPNPWPFDSELNSSTLGINV